MNFRVTACRASVRAREDGGPFTSIWDFTERVDPQVVNNRALESLVKCGALDSSSDSRMGMLAILEQALETGSRHQADRLLGQGSIFDLGDEEQQQTAKRRDVPRVDAAKDELLRMEKETLGLYVSEHPLTPIREQLR